MSKHLLVVGAGGTHTHRNRVKKCSALFYSGLSLSYPSCTQSSPLASQVTLLSVEVGFLWCVMGKNFLSPEQEDVALWDDLLMMYN